jgi:pyruvate,water dikinase
MISRYFVYKQALLNDTALPGKEDIFYLRFPELRAVAAGEVDHELIHQRYDEFRSYRAQTPPRVLTSDGEAVEGRIRVHGTDGYVEILS